MLQISNISKTLLKKKFCGNWKKEQCSIAANELVDIADENDWGDFRPKFFFNKLKSAKTYGDFLSTRSGLLKQYGTTPVKHWFFLS